MSDRTDRPSETTTSPEINGLKPLSNSEELPLVPTANDLSRMSSRAGITIADGLPPGEHDDDDDDDDEEGYDGEYIAVDPEEMNDFSYWFRQPPVHQPTKLDELHPFVQTLNLSNVDDCMNVECAFPENERCSREKVCWDFFFFFFKDTLLQIC